MCFPGGAPFAVFQGRVICRWLIFSNKWSSPAMSGLFPSRCSMMTLERHRLDRLQSTGCGPCCFLRSRFGTALSAKKRQRRAARKTAEEWTSLLHPPVRRSRALYSSSFLPRRFLDKHFVLSLVGSVFFL